MAVTLHQIAAVAGLCAATAGVIYAGVQINHPPADVAHVVTTEMAVRETAKAVMAILALAGFAGMFVYNRERLGVLGVVGYALVSIGYLALFANQVIVGAVLPTVADTDPGYVQAYIDAAVGDSPTRDLGGMAVVFGITGLGYALGGLTFGVALFRARILSRWACLMFAAGTVSALALSVLPESFNRPFAVPVAISLIGLGTSLWRTARRPPDTPGCDATAYTIRVRGHLDPHWSPRLADLALTHHDDGTTTLTGGLFDQAQLHGVLAVVRDINADLLDVHAPRQETTSR